MPEIGKLSLKLGYITAIDFFNQQSVSPTAGAHSALVDHLFNSVTGADFWFFATELYSDASTYWGVLICFDGKVLVVDSLLNPTYINDVPAEVNSLINIDETGDGLQQFFSQEITLADLTIAAATRYLQIYNAVEFGNENWYVRVKDSSVPYYTGVINARTTLDSVLGAYNVKVEKLPYALIECTSAKDQRMVFQVPIAPGYDQEYAYTSMGQKIYVQDTPSARQRVKELVRQGVLFANI